MQMFRSKEAGCCLLLLTRQCQRQAAEGEFANRKSEIGALELCGMDWQPNLSTQNLEKLFFIIDGGSDERTSKLRLPQQYSEKRLSASLLLASHDLA